MPFWGPSMGTRRVSHEVRELNLDENNLNSQPMEIGSVEAARGRIYALLGALFSHPDTGKWGPVLNAQEQHLAIATADRFIELARAARYPIRSEELPCEELDLRFLVVELCQPLDHLKAEYERVLCARQKSSGCSPFALDHGAPRDDALLARTLAQLEETYTMFGFAPGGKAPARADHIAYELEFMNWLITQRRQASRLALFDRQAAELIVACELAQRRFFGDHLEGTLGPLSACLRKYTSGGYFEPLGRFLAAWVPLERHLLQAALHARGAGTGSSIASDPGASSVA